MTDIGVFEAKTHLSRLVERAKNGESFTITQRGVPVAKLVPAVEKTSSADAARAAWDRLQARAAARKGSPTTPEEIKSWIDEGRP